MWSPIEEDVMAVTLVEYPRIVYYKHFHGAVVFPIKHDFYLASARAFKAGQAAGFLGLAGGVDSSQ